MLRWVFLFKLLRIIHNYVPIHGDIKKSRLKLDLRTSFRLRGDLKVTWWPCHRSCCISCISKRRIETILISFCIFYIFLYLLYLFVSFISFCIFYIFLYLLYLFVSFISFCIFYIFLHILSFVSFSIASYRHKTIDDFDFRVTSNDLSKC